ncbi:putative Signal receiver domain fused with GGDEF domain protein [Vibrio nigripulchritudo SO65]|uniref:GGDEF domain-containing response regulator n=1 Tax=Vibrio nigripulchritudo TaxID=28173 RepID=UPI0003B225EF|nr:diguanylate cyclase [Vibrio nigripulchritudo]CCN35645.1 putative Signal receiver domain fused with GGDEF domain protein [Vibrio nigripulchritudo AM115]CCN44532.1 putative Signal receiver domain fused with GGDEF domain protein [Vibrio nigripulchritudo FTn2]CCN77209.1 putative Signal receiver domain fused with GGDEF domain protein [Vibrio nigripulchritudo SO65]
MKSPNTSMRVLLVDDLQFERMQLAIRLKQLGHIVEVVESGQQALEMYTSFDPELILLDINMPEMDGFEVAHEIRSRFEEWVPIIFLSSHEEPETIAKAIETGGDDYLVKPVNKLVLGAKMNAMQRIAQMRRELKLVTSQLEQVNMHLQQQANEDGLTQVYNRRYVDKELRDMVSWHGRHQLPLTVILLDVDHFKAYNDHYGHIEGDNCLQQIASTLDKCFARSGELVGRYGGEEFIVIVSNADQKDALKQAERIHRSIHSLGIPHSKSSTSNYVTLSQGVYSFIPTGRETVEDVYSAADVLLYKAKAEGRDRYATG